MARGVTATFRIDAARAGTESEIEPLVKELKERSPESASMWSENAVQSFDGIVKRVYHPTAGVVSLEYSSLAIDGRPDLCLAVWNPVTEEDQAALMALA